MSTQKKQKKEKEKPQKLELFFDESTEHIEEKKVFCNFLMDGATKQDAANLMGVDRMTIWRWEQADVTFATWVKRSIAYFKLLLVKELGTGWKKDPAYLLERRYPKEYNISKKISVVDPEQELKEILDIIDPDSAEDEIPETSDDQEEQEGEDLGGDIPESEVEEPSTSN